MSRKYWLLKSEPDIFSFDDLSKAPKRTTSWEGVRNYQARNFLRDEIKEGDGVLFYHSNTEDPSIVGVCEVVRNGYPDSFAFDSKSKYFDADAKKKGVNPWYMVDIQAKKRLTVPLNRKALESDSTLKNMMVMKKGSRLSVQPVSPEEFARVLVLGKPQAV